MSPKLLSDSRKIPLNTVGTIPDSRNYSGLYQDNPELLGTTPIYSRNYSGDLSLIPYSNNLSHSVSYP